MTALVLDIYDYKTGELITEASEYEAARYLAMVEEMPAAEREVGAVDGAEFGFPFQTIYMI
jgi:hypothetical protein